MSTISDVLTRIESIIAWSRQHESPLGYFAALYYRMTMAVKAGIDEGLFENGMRMEQLDVTFARRYVDAFDAWQAGKPVNRSWQLAFEATRNPRITVMQHLILGINAHINLDLAIAAAQTRPRDAIFGLHKDFDTINNIISGLVDKVQESLADIWLPFGWLDNLLRSEDEGWANFSISVARDASWRVATALAFAPDASTEKTLIGEADKGVAFLAGKITNGGWLMRLGFQIMCRCEQGSISEKIDALNRVSRNAG